MASRLRYWRVTRAIRACPSDETNPHYFDKLHSLKSRTANCADNFSLFMYIYCYKRDVTTSKSPGGKLHPGTPPTLYLPASTVLIRKTLGFQYNNVERLTLAIPSKAE